MSKIQITISLGELYSKVAELEVKKLKIKDEVYLKRVEEEYNNLTKILFKYDSNFANESKYVKLLEIHQFLWEIKEQIDSFIRMAYTPEKFKWLSREYFYYWRDIESIISSINRRN